VTPYKMLHGFLPWMAGGEPDRFPRPFAGRRSD
jgi:hypothetical protein